MALPAGPGGRGLPILGVTGMGMEDEKPPLGPDLGPIGLHGGAWRTPGLLNGPPGDGAGEGPGGASGPLNGVGLPKGGSGVWAAKLKPLILELGLGVGVEPSKQAAVRIIFAGDVRSSPGQPELDTVLAWP